MRESYTFKFGKHAGTAIVDVPVDYLEWMVANSEDMIRVCKKELDRRQSVESASLTVVERLISAGYKALAQQAHPDKGGSATAFQEVKDAYESLKVAAGMMKEIKR